jgi:hypothetical protein
VVGNMNFTMGFSMIGNVANRLILSAVLIALSILPVSATAQEWTWTTAQIDKEGTDSWIVVDHSSNIHISYRYPTHSQLKYAFLPRGGSRWFTMTLDQMLGDFLTGIALDPKGNPSICYTPGVLKLAMFDGQRWKIQQIDPGSGLVSYYCSVRFGPDGAPQLSWYVEAGIILRHAVLQNGAWIARTVDNQDAPGKFNSMAVDQSGNPQISYIGLTGTKLKYARLNGQDWIRITLEAPSRGLESSHGDTGMGNSIVIDRDGNPMIGYFDISSLKFAHLVNGTWKFEVIDRFRPVPQWGWRFFRSTTVLDRNGYPHIGYQSPLGLKHAWWDGLQWRTQVILAPSGSTFDGAMAIDDKDNLYFSYTDPVQRTLMLATGLYVGDQQTAKTNSPSEEKKQP